MPASVDPIPPHDAVTEEDVTFILEGTGTTNDGKFLSGVMLIDPSTGSPYAATAGNASNTVALHDSATPAQGAVVTVSGSLQTTVPDGDDHALGATTDLATAPTVIGRLKKIISLLPAALTGSGNLKTAVVEALPAGTNLLGSVGLDQTTPGVTNAVSVTNTSLETNHYGTPSAATSVTVGASTTVVLGANPDRKLLVLCNDSANTIYVDLSGADAVLHKGVRLNANGGAIALDRYLPLTAITAIATAANSVLTIQEA